MKMTTAYALAWISVAFCISIAIIATGKLWPLWLFILPANISFNTKTEEEY